MELAKIERLLEDYFEGNTSLVQEQELRDYFKGKDIPNHLLAYKPMFDSFAQARQEKSVRAFQLPESNNSGSFWKLGIAASLLVAIGFVAYTLSQPALTAEEEAALAAFQKTKETMFLLSENLNEGTAKMAHLNEFEKGRSTLKLINHFTESKNLVLK
ncbi:MAG: hypothetical protein KJO23_05970 [Bacteroidia bacterium]|nr:hypothetical protein [Bacteroidia bacterium]NNM23987.1 hypothetical protein [Flavobacteriaceae bacterium]